MRSFAAISKLFIMKIYMLNMHQLDWVGCLLAALVLRFIQFWLCRVCDLKYHRNASFRPNEREWSERMQSKEKIYSEMEWKEEKKHTPPPPSPRTMEWKKIYGSWVKSMLLARNLCTRSQANAREMNKVSQWNEWAK